MQLSARVEEALSRVEICASELSAALVSGEPLGLTAASGALQQASVDFSELMQGLTTADRKSVDLQLRVKQVSACMAAQREALIRRTVLVNRALNEIVPATCNTTYAKTAGPSSQPYGSAVKQTGSFKVLAA